MEREKPIGDGLERPPCRICGRPILNGQAWGADGRGYAHESCERAELKKQEAKRGK